MTASHTPGALYWLDGNLYRDGRFVASSFDYDGQEGMAPDGPDAHLATLFVLAPELADALRTLTVACANVRNTSEQLDALATARAVLAKLETARP